MWGKSPPLRYSLADDLRMWKLSSTAEWGVTGELIVYGEGRKKQLAFCSVAKAMKYLRHGCAGYLAYAMTSSAEEKKLSVADVPVVSEYSDDFPEDLLGIPPEREVEFGIDLVPGAAPVAHTPYRLAPPEP
ncbi:hypothetical protein OSB04_019599 [Centaurea solstitialis]|uniref:Reverse transcriptase domain-containing protein n=1 Tax=Centaurea solstitialis TaxID=347529 RepID=A0AA38WG21_9ASTR|nr:hypothetical protein OSB04_019599 [Centaurea solstitialis]